MVDWGRDRNRRKGPGGCGSRKARWHALHMRHVRCPCYLAHAHLPLPTRRQGLAAGGGGLGRGATQAPRRAAPHSSGACAELCSEGELGERGPSQLTACRHCLTAQGRASSSQPKLIPSSAQPSPAQPSPAQPAPSSWASIAQAWRARCRGRPAAGSPGAPFSSQPPPAPTVTAKADPSDSGTSVWMSPLPKVVSPTMVARLLSFRAPASTCTVAGPPQLRWRSRGF